jgi:DNA-binding transcriptional MocR family regulator
VKLTHLSHSQLAERERQLEAQYQQHRRAGLKLDLTRGKPSPEQVALSDGMETIIEGRWVLEDGADVRNYGGLEGIPAARKLGAELLGARPDEVIVGGNGSLTLMYQYLLCAWLHGVQGPETAWRTEPGPIKFLCPVPGYDRHFTICEDLGIEMIPVPMTADGPDLDRVEALVRHDPLIKGIWCVPKYSNPTGHVYAESVVERFARLAWIAGRHFRIVWDNAYAVHDLDDRPMPLTSIFDLCRRLGTEDSVVTLGSTSKITRAGAGIGFLAMSAANLKAFRQRLSVYTIGPDKVNQLRHVLFLKNLQGVLAHMQKHAAILRPKFEAVLRHLDSGLAGSDMGRWTRPRGGYFISFDAQPGLAKEIVRLAGEAGVKLTPAGATFPYGRDPDDSNIRLAPTYPSLNELDQAMRVFVTCVQLATVRQRLAKA